METKKKITIEKETTENIFCNSCGNSCKVAQLEDGYSVFSYATISAQWGYFSNKDLTSQVAHLCENCCDELMSKFKIPPTEKISW